MKEKLKSMTFLQKIEYIWMYYKVWLLAALLLAGGIWLGITMYHGMNTPVLLNIVITGGDNRKAKSLEEDFCAYAGIEEKDGIVRVQANIPEDGGGVNSKTALTTLFGANAVDVLICSKEVYEEYRVQGGFEEEALVLTAPNVLGGHKLADYGEIYAAIPVNCQNKEMACRFLQYISEEFRD